MRLGFLSDLHLDVNNIPASASQSAIHELIKDNDLSALFIAGDTFNNFKKTLKYIDEINEQSSVPIYFILGNHEFWSRTMTYEYSNEDISPFYLNNKSVEVGGATIVGFNGWFDYSFVTELDNIYNQTLPKDIEELESIGWRNFDLSRIGLSNHQEIYKNSIENLISTLNSVNKDKDIIAFTHFIPHEQFLTYRDPVWNACNAFMGSLHTKTVLEGYSVKHCIFGHTHSRYGPTEINGVTYHCRPLGYRQYDGTWESGFEDELKKSLTIIEV